MIIVRGRIVASRKHSVPGEERPLGTDFGQQNSARTQEARLVARGLRVSRKHRPQLHGRSRARRTKPFVQETLRDCTNARMRHCQSDSRLARRLIQLGRSQPHNPSIRRNGVRPCGKYLNLIRINREFCHLIGIKLGFFVLARSSEPAIMRIVAGKNAQRGPGRPPKTALDLDLTLNEKQRYWLDYLTDKGFRGNTVEEVALRLLDEKCEELDDKKSIPDAFLEPIRSDKSVDKNKADSKPKELHND